MKRLALQRWIPFRLAALVAPLIAAWPQRAEAQTIYWDRGNTTNLWADVANWSTAAGAATPNPGAVPGAANTVVFNITTLNTAQTIDMGAARSVLGLGFVSTGTVLIQGGGAAQNLTIGASGISKTGTGAVTIGSTTATQAANIILGANQTWTNSAAGDLNALNVISGAFNLNLAGAGVFRFAGANTYTGTTTIGAGTTLIAQANAALGTTAGGTTISAGGTLNLGGTLGANTLNLGTEAISVSGAGVGGLGAIVNTGSNGQQFAIQGAVTMTGNTTFGGSQRWDIRNGTLNGGGGGFDLTKVGTNSIFLSGSSQIGTSLNSLIIRQGEYVFETGALASAAKLTHATAGINIAPTTAVTASFRSWGNNVDHSAAITLDSSFAGSTSRLMVQNGTTSHSGTITAIGGNNQLDVEGNQRMIVSGVLAGVGDFRKEGAGLLLVNNAGNTQSGLFTVNIGILGGSGTLASSTVAVNNGTMLSPGNALGSSGALSVTNILDLNGTNSAVFNLGASSDVVNAGTLNQDGTTNIFVSRAAGFTPGTYTLFDYNTISGVNGFGGFSLAASHVDGTLVHNLGGTSVDLMLNSLNPLRWTGESNGLWNSGSMTNPTLSNFHWAADPDTKVEYVNFDNVLFNDTNTGTTSIRVNSTITPASIEFDNSVLNYTLDTLAPAIAGGNIAGTTGIVKNGTATTTLLGANTFTGTIAVNAGTLQFGNHSRVATFNGGNDQNPSGAGPAITIAPGATLGIAVGNNVGVTYSNNISGGGNILLNASEQDPYFNYAADRGLVNFTGDNSGFSGTITIQDGNRLGITSATQLGGAAGVVVQDGGSLYTPGAFTAATPLSIAGRGWSETTGMLGALRLGGGVTLSGPVTLTGDSRITAFGGAGTLSGVISGAHNLDFGFNHTGTGSGTITLSNPASTYSGDTRITRMTINADTLAIAGANSSLGSGDDIVMNASTLNVTGAGPMTTDRTLTLGNLGIGASTIGVTNPANTLTLTGVINNAQPVAASGSAFRQGLNFLQTTTAGTGGTVVINTATPIITSGTTVHRQNLTLAGNTNFTVGASGLGAAGAFNVGNSTGADVGNATLNIQDNAVLTVFGDFDIGNQGVAQTYVVNQSGTSTVNALRGGGVGSGDFGATSDTNRGLRIGHWGLENSTYNLTGGTLNVPNGHLWVGYDGQATFNQSAGTTVNAIGLRMVRGATLPAAYNLNGGILNIGASGFAKGGAGATVPQFNFNGGTYRATASHDIGANIAINLLAGGGTIDTNGFNVTSGSALLVGAGGSFTKAGLGELTLPSSNSVSGGILINGGSLSSVAGATIAASTVTVNNGGTLGGGFNITSAGGVVVNSGGTVSPGANNGAGGGTLTTSLLTLSAGSQLNLTPTADLISVTTAATGLTGNTNINVLPVGTLAASPINLINYVTAHGLTFTSSLPHLIGASVVDNTTGNIQLLHGGQETLTWTGAANGNWDTASVNFNASVSGAVNYLQGDVSVFDDSTAPANPAIIVAAGGVTPASVVINDAAGLFSFSGGGINGGTSLTKNGAGTSILANNNAYAGTTTINAGTLQIGNGGTAGTLGLGATTNNGTLSFNRSDASSYLGVIGGTGIVRHDGTGTTTLGAHVAAPVANTYSGGTVISKGTLQGNHNSFGTNTITLNDASTGANNTALLFQNGAVQVVTNNIVVSNNGSGTATIGSSEDSLVASGLQFTGTLTLDRPTRLLGELDRTTFSGIISGTVGTLTIGRSAGLEDFEVGRVVLEKNNTFTGNVVVENFATLEIRDISNTPADTAKNQIPDTASVTLGDTSFLQLGNSGAVADGETIGDLVSSFSTSVVRNISTGIASPNNVALTYGTANDATFNGVVAGGNTFDLIKQGAGTQTFGGTLDNNSARMIVNEGTVVLAKDSSNVVHAIGGPLVINNTGTVQLGGTYTAFRDESSNRDNATQYQVNAPANFGDQIFNNVDVTVNAGGTLDLNGKSEVFDGLIGAGTVTNSNAVASTLYLGAANSADTFSGVIQNGPGVVNIAKGGSGTMIFGGTNTYSGTTSINAGTLTITNIAALGTAAGGTFINSNRENAGTASQLLISVATASDPTTPNILAEPLTLTSELSNDLRTNIQNTVESTRLTGLITIQGDGLNQINAAQAAGDQFQINGGISGTATGQLFLRGNGEMALNSVINAPNVIVSKTDPGLLILGVGGHNYHETNFVHGTVRADAVNALDTGAVLRMGQNGNNNTFDLNGNSQQVGGLLSNLNLSVHARTITSVAPATLTISNVADGDDYLYTGNITGAITLVKSGAGAQVFGTPASGVNSWAGDTVINNGTIRLANSNVIPDGVTAGNMIVGTGATTAHFDLNGNAETINGLHGNALGLVTSNGAGNAVLTVNGTATPAVSATFAGSIQNRTDLGTGTLALTKTGTGTQILTGINPFTGPTTINGGILQVDGINALSAVTVNTGGTLGGTGTVGIVTVNTGGILSPGASPGTLATGNASASAGSFTHMDIDGLLPGDGAGFHDQLSTTGTISLDGTLVLNLTYTPTSVTKVFLWLNDSTDTITGIWSGLPEGSIIGSPTHHWVISYDDDSFGNPTAVSNHLGNDVSLYWIPEPGSSTLAILAGALALGRRRRRAA